LKITLDTVPDANASAADTAQALVADYPDVTYRVITESGPAGGNPVIRYRGPREQLETMVIKHYGKDAWELTT
jgi:hypothetical protein